jgi:MFS family permease
MLFFAIGGAMYANAPIKNALVSQHAQQEFSGSLFGIVQTIGALGSAIGPALLGVLATELTIAVAYPLIAVISLIIGSTFLLVSRNIRNQSETQPTHQPA